jgi:hypothetical protein
MQENVDAKVETKKVMMNQQITSNEFENAKRDIEQLFYAIQLLIRGLRPYRVKISDLMFQKELLKQQVATLEEWRTQVYEIVKSLAIDSHLIPTDESPRRPATFRGTKTYETKLKGFFSCCNCSDCVQ